MSTNVVIKIPRSLPALWDEKADGYRLPGDATVGQWRLAKRSARKGELIGAVTPRTYASAVNRMVKIADLLGLPDDVVLLPRLRALADPNVQSIHGNALKR
jgi:hypothetical protein